MKDKDITLAHVIIELMPFSEEILNWCSERPEFLSALKNVYPNRFISLGAVVVSYPPPPNSSDQVIGVFVYDLVSDKFKQDFIVNLETGNEQFVLYTRNLRSNSTKYVKDINAFYDKYGSDGSYKNTHHMSLNQLPKELVERGKHAIKLAEKVKQSGLREFTHDYIVKQYHEIRSHKSSGSWYDVRKLT